MTGVYSTTDQFPKFCFLFADVRHELMEGPIRTCVILAPVYSVHIHFQKPLLMGRLHQCSRATNQVYKYPANALANRGTLIAVATS